MSQHQLISIKEAAEMLSVSTLTLRNWDKSGKLTPSRHPLNNYRVYKRADIERLVEEIGHNTKPVALRGRKAIKKLKVIHLGESETKQ